MNEEELDIKAKIIDEIVHTMKVKKTFDSDGTVHVKDYRVTFKIPKDIKIGMSGVHDNTFVFEFRRRWTLALQE